jgi:hypothetical protein
MKDLIIYKRLRLLLLVFLSSINAFCQDFSLPFIELFNNTVFPPVGWEVFIGTNGLGTSNNWIRSTSSTYEGSGSAFVDIESTGFDEAEDWLVSPKIYLNASSITVLSFYQKKDIYFNWGASYAIKVSTTSQTDPSSFIDLETYDESIMNSSSYSKKTVDFSAYNGQEIYIAFVMTQSFAGGWYIDSLMLTSSCNLPRKLEIVGNSCAYTSSIESYFIDSLPGTSLVWITNDGTITGSGNSVNVSWNSEGKKVLTVTPSNSCGTGLESNLNIDVLDSNDPPNVPILTYPDNSASNIVDSLTFKWDNSCFTNSFEIQVSELIDFNTIFYTSNGIVENNHHVSDLTDGSQYYWRTRAINNWGASGWSEIRSFTTIAKPSTQASNLVFSNIGDTYFNVSWTNGNGERRIVFIKEGDFVEAIPTDKTTYTSDPKYKSGSQIGSSGWYCVYQGQESFVAITSLSPSTLFQIMVIEFNGEDGTEKYLTDVAENNPMNQSTACDTKWTGNLVQMISKGENKYDFSIKLSYSDEYCSTQSTIIFHDVSIEQSLHLTYGSGYVEGTVSSDGNSINGTYNNINLSGCDVDVSGSWSASRISPLPPDPSAINGDTIPCSGNAYEYHVSYLPDVTYNWTVTGGTISGNGNSINVIWDNTGNYTLSVALMNTCWSGKNKSLNVNVNSCTNIDANENNRLKINIYPNPVNEELNIVFENIKSDLSVKITSIDGRVIFSKDYNYFSNDLYEVINFTHQSRGIYFIMINDGQRIKTEKIIVE